MRSLAIQTWFSAVHHRRLVALVLTFGCGGSFLLAQAVGVDGLLVIQRIRISPERAAKELEKAPEGTLHRLPLQDFNERVNRIRLAQQAREHRPRLTRAHYSAELIDRSLTNGSGQWAIFHPGNTPSILAVESFNLALHKLRWEQPGDAVLTEFDSKSLGLLVTRPGVSSCLLDWSAQGVLTNDGISFQLAVPPCPSSTFEFKLPSDYWLSASKDGAIVTGPHEAETTNKRVWKLQVAGAKQVAFTVRRLAESGTAAPTVFARVESTQQLAPDRITVEHEFQIDILHGSVRELVLDGDVSLRPYIVSLQNGEVKSWEWHEVPAQTDAKGEIRTPASGVLTIQFPQPVHGKLAKLRVRSIASRPPGPRWTSPYLRTRNAYSRGEMLEVHLHPDFAVGQWDQGSFQPTHIATAGDGTQKLTLADTAADAAGSRRPTLLLPAKDVDLHTTEAYTWRIGAAVTTLAGEVRYAATRGNLFELRLKLPPTSAGYQIESLDTHPPELLHGWHTDGNFAVVDLKQPLTPTRDVAVKIHLRRLTRDWATGINVVKFPELDPIDAVKRKGSVSIHVDPLFQATLAGATMPLAPFDERLAERTSFRFLFRDQGLGASLRLVPQAVQFQLIGKHSATLAAHHARLRFHWVVQPVVGAPAFLDFRFSPGFPPAWNVDTGESTLKFHHWERLFIPEALPPLLQLGMSQGLQAAALESMLPRGEYWRFYLSEPLSKQASFSVEASVPTGIVDEEWRRAVALIPNTDAWSWLGAAVAHQTLPKSAPEKTWSLPLMMPVPTTHVQQEINVESPEEPIVKVVSGGSLRAPTELFKQDKSPLHLRLQTSDDGHRGHADKVTVWTRPEKQVTSVFELCDEAVLSTYLYKDGRCFHRIQFRLWHWRERGFEIRLPSGTKVLSAKLHDRFLEHLNVEDAQEQIRLRLPFDQNSEYVRYEILVRAPEPARLLPGLQRVEIPRLGWPIAPLDLRTRYFLEADLAPLQQDSLAPVGVPSRIARQSATPRWIKQIWSFGQSWWPTEEQTRSLEKIEDQKQLVLSGEAKLRGGSKKKWKLADLLERFAVQELQGQTALIVDRVAFRSLALTGETVVSPAGRPFWEALNLVYVPTTHGAVLTSPQRLSDLGIQGPAEAVELDDAVQEAILHGHDASSGFYLAVSWLKLPPHDASASTGGGPFPAAAYDGQASEMSEWATRADGAPLDRLYVADPRAARILGWILAVLIGVLVWKAQRSWSPLSCFRAYILVLAVSVLLVIWLPQNSREFFAFPALGVECIGFLICVWSIVGRRGETIASGNSTVSHLKTPVATASLAVLSLGLAWSATAQPPSARAFVAFVIDGAEPAVLISQDLLARLDELDKQPLLVTPGAVLVSAKYSGKYQDANATFEVQYEIHSFKDKTNLVIPLAEVQLNEGAFLDGAPVFPAPHKTGYIVPIRGKGAHHLRLSFSVRTTMVGDYLDLRFTIPKLLQNEAALHWPTQVQAVHCLHCGGEEKTITGSGQGVQEWRGQLGYEKTLHLRWTSPAILMAPKAIETKEAHYWDLRPGSLSLATVLNYAIGAGALGQATITMPEGLNVRHVEAWTSPAPPAVATPIVVKNWTLAGAGDSRRLVVEFVQPVSGQMALHLEIVPRAFGQSRQLLLPLPASLQGKSVAGLLGYRLNAAEITPRFLAVQGVSSEEFEQLWKKQTGKTIQPASRAFVFQRNAPQAGLELKIQPASAQTQFHLDWTLDRHFAQMHGKFAFTSTQEDLVLLEFFIDPFMTLAEVTGTDVRRWHLQDSRLQVWLRQARKQTSIELVGWRVRSSKESAQAKSSFVLPCIYPLAAHLGSGTLEVRPATGIQIDTEQLRRLRQTFPGKHLFTIEEEPGPYEAAFRVTAPTQQPDAEMTTKVRSSEAGIELWHGVRLITDRGQLPSLTLRLKDWPYEPLVLDAPGAIVVPSTGQAAWTINYPSGLPQEVFLVLRGRASRVPRDGILLPQVELEQATVRRHELVWKDVEIVQGQNGVKWTPPKLVNEVKTDTSSGDWPREMPGWNRAVAGPSLKVLLPKVDAQSRIRSLGSSEDSRWTGERHWLHQASYWIHAPARTELRFKFPGPVESFSVMVNRHLQSAANSAPLEYALPLEADTQPRRVELRWRYVDQAERDAPSIAAMQIEGVPLPSHLRVVWVPRGLSATQPSRHATPTLLSRLLHDAEMQMTLSEWLAKELTLEAEHTKQIATHQQSFYACLRHAEYALSVLSEGQRDFDFAAWSTRLAQLKKTNAERALEHRYDDQRKAAENFRGAPVMEDGYDSGMPFLLTANSLSLSLQSEWARASAERRIRSEIFLLSAIFLLVFSYFRHGWSILRLAAPEIGIALAVTGFTLYGVGLIGMGLIGVMLVIRAFAIVAALKKRWGRSASNATNVKQPSTMQPPATPS